MLQGLQLPETSPLNAESFTPRNSTTMACLWLPITVQHITVETPDGIRGRKKKNNNLHNAAPPQKVKAMMNQTSSPSIMYLCLYFTLQAWFVVCVTLVGSPLSSVSGGDSWWGYEICLVSDEQSLCGFGRVCFFFYKCTRCTETHAPSSLIIS